jgi:hypothetical protein
MTGRRWYWMRYWGVTAAVCLAVRVVTGSGIAALAATFITAALLSKEPPPNDR